MFRLMNSRKGMMIQPKITVTLAITELEQPKLMTISESSIN